MTEAMLRALIEALEADMARPADATEAGRVFSAANETQLRAAVTALNALLAQVSLPPDPNQQPQPGQPAVPGAVPPKAAAVVPVAQSVAAPVEGLAVEGALGLTEEAAKGKGLIRVITPGWGTSGFYSPGVLERDAPAAFPAGTKMYWDHPTAHDGRPERSLRDLAAELTEDARWMSSGPEGPGVYSKAKVFSGYQPVIEELAPHIGVSIRSSALIRQGEAEGRKGPIVERLIPAPTNSVDFVTIPGRGGRVTALFEAARGSNNTPEGDDVSEAELKAAQEAQATAERQRDAALEAVAASRAGIIAAGIVARTDIPQPAQARLHEALIKGTIPMKDGALDEAAFTESATKVAAAEKAFLDSIMGKGRVVGMGSGTVGEAGGEAPKVDDFEAAFKRMGLTESAAKVAGAGRTN